MSPREGYRVWIRYADEVAGEVDLSDLAGRGVFKAWENRSCFEAVRVAADGGIAWGDEIELFPDALYMRLTDKSVSTIARRQEGNQMGKWLVENMPRGINLELPDRGEHDREIPFLGGD
ncbi:DUF2442 domain-containing protein [Candidatus Poriferisocius sp.]|uniref:DUF2442 domain-containing protein n=1 Tax=Candidatus Poriferisocius sp. TaxID=3101276 RepID=UPI003B0208C0